jgi:hypothetical protein
MLWRFLCSSRIIKLRFEPWWSSSCCLQDSFLFFRWRSSRYWKISIRVDSLWKIGTKLEDHRRDPYHVVSDYWVYHCKYFWLIDLQTIFRLDCSSLEFMCSSNQPFEGFGWDRWLPIDSRLREFISVLIPRIDLVESPVIMNSKGGSSVSPPVSGSISETQAGFQIGSLKKSHELDVQRRASAIGRLLCSLDSRAWHPLQQPRRALTRLG